MRDGCQRAPSARQKPAFFSVSVRPFARSFDTSLLPLPEPQCVPGQVSAFKFENDLSCPLNNR